MTKNRDWESFAWIVVWVFILSFVVLAIISVLNHSTRLTSQYETENDIWRLERNFNNILSKLDTWTLNMGDEFFIYKNIEEQRFDLIGLDDCISNPEIWWDENTCQNFQFIDSLWNHIENIEEFEWDIFSHRWIINTSDDTFWFSYQKFDIEVNQYNN